MTFLSPLALLGLAAAAIPVVVHLFNLRRPQTVDFSSLVFVKELERRTMRRMRIRQWLLLALRVLAIACLVLAFSRPVLTGDAAATMGGSGSAARAVVIDNSLSMTLRGARGAYLDQAKARAAALLGEMTLADEVFVAPTAPGDTLSDAAYPGPEAARAAVAALGARPGAATLAESARRAAGALDEATYARREIYLVSDLQKNTLADSLAANLPADVQVFLLPVGGDRSHANVAITGVEVASRIVDAGQPVRIEATLEAFGAQAYDDYVASLYLEDRRVAQATADLTPGRAVTVDFTATLPKGRNGWLNGRIEIAGDGLRADNTRRFALHVPETRRVLLVRGTGQSARYVELALSPEVTQGRRAFEVQTIGEEALTGARLGAYDAVVLIGPQTLSSGERAALERYVSDGGGLFFFPGADASLKDYNALFDALGGGRFEGYVGTRGGAQPVATFARVATKHPLFEGVFDPTGGEIHLERAEVYYAITYAPRSGLGQTLIEMTNGQPFLQELRHGRGTVLLMTVAPNEQWSDLPTRGLFIPLLYRSLAYLAAGADVQGPQLLAGQPEALRLTNVPQGVRLSVVGPGGMEWIPEQRDLFGAVLLDLGALHTLGFYDVRAGDTLVTRLAVNTAPRESNSAVYGEAEAAAQRLSEALGVLVHVLEGDGEALQQAFAGAAPAAVELWYVFLLAALAFLAAEMLVARRGKREPVAA